MDMMQWAVAPIDAGFSRELDGATMLARSGAAGPSVLQVQGSTCCPRRSAPLLLAPLRTSSARIERAAPAAGQAP